MSADGPFAPPAPVSAGSGGAAPVVGAWAMSGASVGTLAGATLQLVGLVEGIVPFGLGSAAGFAAIGAGAYAVERRLAGARPALVDARGRPTRPARLWVYATPLVLGVLGLLGLVVIASVRQQSLGPGLAFAGVATGMLWLLRPLVASSRLAGALEDLERGHTARARQAFETLERAWWAPRAGRAQARLNLGVLALRRGDLDAAARWYAGPRQGRTGAFAATGLALVRVMQGRYSEVEPLLRRANGGGVSVQAEVDGVRLLLVLRRDGPDDALVLGERLLDAGSGGLFRAALAAARLACGDPAGARSLFDRAPSDPILRRAVPELDALAPTTAR